LSARLYHWDWEEGRIEYGKPVLGRRRLCVVPYRGCPKYQLCLSARLYHRAWEEGRFEYGKSELGRERVPVIHGMGES
jgi:hypothetical protein